MGGSVEAVSRLRHLLPSHAGAGEEVVFEDLRGYFNEFNSYKWQHFLSSNDICTPMECVKEMVDAVPEEFWRRDGVRILDSCCGNGNFHAYIAQKTALRHLYFNDINEQRAENVRRLFGSEARLTRGDFLCFPDDEKYDMIVSNPPYALINDGKRAAKNHNLSRAFIEKSLRLVAPGGYLLFIAPDNWMSLSDRNGLPRRLGEGQFVRLNIHGAKRWFPKVGSSFTWFLWCNRPNREAFEVENHYRLRGRTRVALPRGWDFIPLILTREVVGIVEKTLFADHARIPIETTSDLHRTTKKALLSAERGGEFVYKVRHTPKQVLWSRRAHKFQEGWKVFLSLTDRYGAFVDDGGMTQSIAFVRCGSLGEAEALRGRLEDNLLWFVNEITRYGNFNNIRVLQRFPYPEAVRLTARERRFVEAFAARFRRG